LHFLIPLVLALLFFRKEPGFSYLVMMLTMLVDLDHLLATPIFDPNRCSIGFHPLHGTIPIIFYIIFCFIPKTRLVGIGLTVHMMLDLLDCFI
jgi:hypothetical protein